MMKPAAGRAPLELKLDKGACNWHAWVKRAQEDATSLPTTELVQYLAELMATNARPALAGWGVKTTAALLAAHAEDAAALPEPQNTDPAAPGYRAGLTDAAIRATTRRVSPSSQT